MTDRSAKADGTLRLTCLDMQPIDPPIGGGRARLLGLYHALGTSIRATYVGSYDWPGPGFRRHDLTPTLEEIDVPLPDEVFEAHDRLRDLAGGRTVIDVLFPVLGECAHRFIEMASERAAASDIVVFSHPWIYPLVRAALDPERQLVVYDSQNVEGVLRAEMFGDSPIGCDISRYVAVTEYDLVRTADVVLACSREDAKLFASIYDADPAKVMIAPNGTFVSRIRPATPIERRRAKHALQLQGEVAVFVGSGYGPNVEGVRYICSTLAPALPEVTFVIGGDVVDAFGEQSAPSNVRLWGVLSEDEKREVLRAADIAVNPVWHGSGTNLKMFEFMAAGLPLVTTPVGCRGIDKGRGSAFDVADASGMTAVVSAILQDGDRRASMGAQARQLVERSYAWERISPWLGETLATAFARKSTARSARRGCSSTDVPSEP